MVVRQHGPEATKRRRGNAHADLWQVALQEGLDELLAPVGAVRLGARQKGGRKATTAPVTRQRLLPELVEAEAAHRDRLEPPRQRLGGLPKQGRRRAPQDQEARANGTAIGENAKDREQVRSALDLVDDDDTPQRLERRHRLLEAREGDRVLQVEIAGRIGRQDPLCCRGLAALARSEQRDDTTNRKLRFRFSMIRPRRWRAFAARTPPAAAAVRRARQSPRTPE